MTIDETDVLSDNELLKRAQKGEIACYGALVARHHGRLYRVAHKILQNEADAEDAIQEIFLHSFRRLHQFEGRSAVVTWLSSIVANEAFTRIRRRVPWQSLDAPSPISGDQTLADRLHARARNPEQQAIGLETENGIRSAVAALPREYCSVFQLREIEGLTAGEASARLGITKNCLKARLFRARSLLRARLGCSDDAQKATAGS